MEFCKFCHAIMQQENETLSSGHHYRFFCVCPKCGAIYEGEKKEQKQTVSISNTRWFNPTTKEFEQET